MKALVLTFALLAAATITHAQTWKVPAESQRCPSKWGAGDERGSGNHMKPASVMRAKELIKTGEISTRTGFTSSAWRRSAP